MKKNGNPNRKESIIHAFAGLAAIFRTEPNTRIHLAATIATVALGAWLMLSPIEWALIAFAIGAVWIAELANTAVEIIVDMITEEYSEEAKLAKDLGAGAVMAAAITAVVIGLLVLGPPLLARF